MTAARSPEPGRARLLLRIAVIALGLLAAAKLSSELLRLVVWDIDHPSAAVDLRLRHREAHAWFDGRPVYRDLRDAVYPPATYSLLWPFLGWLPLQPARVLWAVTALLALAWMARLIVRESGATGGWQAALAALLLLAMNQTGVALGNGQLVLHILPVLLAGLLLIHRGRGSWADDIAAAACVVFAMVKITIAVPFLWLALFAPVPNADGRSPGWRGRPAVLVAVGYGALTVLAATFQDGGVALQLREWLATARKMAELGGDYGNVHSWLRELGLDTLMLPASAVLLLGLGLWLYRYRGVDLWVRLGVVGLIARVWTYHRLYDDVLVVLGLVALFRLATGGTRASSSAAGEPIAVVRLGAPADRAAAWLVAITMLTMLLPARLGTSAPPWNWIFNGSHTITWLGVLAFLGWWAAAERARVEAEARPAARPVVRAQPSA